MEEIFYTYIYYDPSRNNEPFYIGKGHGERFISHLKRDDPHPMTYRVKKMLQNGITPLIGVYAGYDEEFAFFLEEELIKMIGRRDLKKGPLLNLTNGGEGTKNVAKFVRDKVSKALTGVPLTEERRKKIGDAHRGRKASTKTKAKMSKARLGTKITPEQSKARSLRQIGNKLSEETKRKISETLTGFEITEETKRKISESLKGIQRDEEYGANMSKAKKGVPLSDAHKEGIKKGWILRKLKAQSLVDTSL